MAGTIEPQEVFEVAMSLMDELSMAGAADTADTAEYKNRTLAILNVLQIELFPHSDMYQAGEGGRRAIPEKILSFSEPMTDMDDGLAMGVMPYGLAGRLLAAEGDERGNFYLESYEEMKRNLRHVPSEFEPIHDVYGMLDYKSGW